MVTFYGNPGAKGKQSTPDVLKVIQDYSRLYSFGFSSPKVSIYGSGFRCTGWAWTCSDGFPNASRSGVADVPLRLAQQRSQGWFKNQSNSIQQGMVSLFPSFSHWFHLSFKDFKVF
jgi:hypothetical protein